MSLLLASAMDNACSSVISAWVSIPVRGGIWKGRIGGTSVVVAGSTGRRDETVSCARTIGRDQARNATAQRGIERADARIRRVLLPRSAWVEAPRPNRKPIRALCRVCERTFETSVAVSYRRRVNKIQARRARLAADTGSALRPPTHR